MLPIPGFMVVILIGIAIGFIARFFYVGPNTVHGFVLTAVLGLVGAYLPTILYRLLGIIEPNQLADPISMLVGAMIVLFIWNKLATHRYVYDPGIHHPSVTQRSDTKES